MSAARKLTFVEAADVETQRFAWGSLNWLSEPRVTAAERFSAGVVTLQRARATLDIITPTAKRFSTSSRARASRWWR